VGIAVVLVVVAVVFVKEAVVVLATTSVVFVDAAVVVLVITSVVFVDAAAVVLAITSVVFVDAAVVVLAITSVVFEYTAMVVLAITAVVFADAAVVVLAIAVVMNPTVDVLVNNIVASWLVVDCIEVAKVSESSGDVDWLSSTSVVPFHDCVRNWPAPELSSDPLITAHDVLMFVAAREPVEEKNGV
jgi:hypothetical protein